MGTKNNPGQFDCYHNALPDEPMFVLLARNDTAPDYVEAWAFERVQEIMVGDRPESDFPMVMEAMKCATDMRNWRAANEGAWRKKQENRNG